MNREVKTGEWVELDEAYPLQRIESGTFEIYVVYAPASGRTRRKYLCEEGPGGYLYFFPDEGGDALRLLAIATSPALLRPMTREEIVAADIRQQVLCLESLLKILSCRPERHLLPRTSKSLDAGARETLPAGTRLVAPPGHPLAWLELPREAVGPDDTDRFFGESELLYLPAGDSVAMTADAEVTAWDTETVISRYGKNFVIEASYSEAVQFGRAYRSYFEAEDRTDAGRLGEFARMKELLLSNSFSELMRNLIPDLPFVSRMEDRNQPPVIHALQEIGEWFGIARDRFRLPDGAEQFTEVRDILRILGNRDLHGREVSLEPGWEKTDIGPLLAFRDGTPLAVLPVTPEHYEYVDLEAGKRVPVTAEIAAGFDTRAYCFCQGLPEDIDSLWKWFRWAARLCWERDYWLLLFCCLIAGFIPVITPLVTQTIFNDIIPSYDKNALLLVVQVMFVTSVSGALISLVRGITVLRLKNHVRVSAESALWIKLLSLPAAFFRRYQVGDLALRMQGVSALSHQLSSTVANGIFNGIFCFWNLLLMFWYSYKMALLAVFVWFVFLVLSLIFSWRKVRFQREKATASGRVSGQLLQLLNGLNKFRLRAAEERAFYLWTKPFGEEWKWNRKSRWQDNWLGLITQAQPLVLNFCVFYFVMSQLDMERLTGAAFMSTASFLSFNSAMGSFGNALNGFKTGIVTLWGLMPAMERILPILREKSEVSESKLPASELTGEMEVADVSFRYKPDLPLVLKNIRFSVRPGTFLAIAGSSGSGKSTLLRVLLGLEKPESGSVLYDGQDIGEIDVSSVRRQIGVVMQHGQLLEGSIFSNIVGSLPLTMDDAWEVARLVGLEADIKELPMGMNTLVNEGGTTFSGGQRQRLMIARSLVNHPRIVVFDEATSSLDNETQAIVSETLETMRATRIVVAHRLSTIQNADRILVLDRGQIVEDGTYDELMAKNGFFAELARRQIA